MISPVIINRWLLVLPEKGNGKKGRRVEAKESLMKRKREREGEEAECLLQIAFRANLSRIFLGQMSIFPYSDEQLSLCLRGLKMSTTWTISHLPMIDEWWARYQRINSSKWANKREPWLGYNSLAGTWFIGYSKYCNSWNVSITVMSSKLHGKVHCN